LTLTNLIKYIHQHIQHPAQFLIRYTKQPSQCLTTERIAKRCLQRMQDLGINTDAFKSHSLRGAIATHLIKKGVPQTLVQARGGWTNPATLQQYYNRLHQSTDWEGLLQQGPLGETDKERQSAACVVLLTKPSSPEPTKEGGRKEGEEASTTQAAALAAQGILRSLYDNTNCPTCNVPIHHEAGFRCTKCKFMYHVRCLATTENNQQKSHQPSYLTRCYLCQIATGGVGPRGRATAPVQRIDDLIEDPMGVCQSAPA
jgi:hypothetical protein